MAKRFKWRLDPVKKIKERQEDQEREALASARNALAQEESRLADLKKQRIDFAEQLRQQQSGRLNLSELARLQAYLNSLDKKIKHQATQVKTVQETANQQQETLLKAMQDRKALENLRERDHQKFRKTEKRREQATTDETANRRAQRKDV
ncbi:MAG: flagellar export protein FliJ [bacterium]|nr:flagellar export protein FliJ [bacterium]